MEDVSKEDIISHLVKARYEPTKTICYLDGIYAPVGKFVRYDDEDLNGETEISIKEFYDHYTILDDYT